MLNEALAFEPTGQDVWSKIHARSTRRQSDELHLTLSDHYAPELKDISGIATPKTENDFLVRTIKHYKDDSQHINGTLIKAHHDGEYDNVMKSGVYSQRISRLDKFLGKYKAPKDFVVYSGISKAWANSKIKHTKIGEHFYSPAYLSASTRPSMAIGFGGSHLIVDRSTPKEIHVLQIHIPEGSQHGAYIAHVGQSSEREFLIGRDKFLKYHGVVHTLKDETATGDDPATVYIHKVSIV